MTTKTSEDGKNSHHQCIKIDSLLRFSNEDVQKKFETSKTPLFDSFTANFVLLASFLLSTLWGVYVSCFNNNHIIYVFIGLSTCLFGLIRIKTEKDVPFPFTMTSQQFALFLTSFQLFLSFHQLLNNESMEFLVPPMKFLSLLPVLLISVLQEDNNLNLVAVVYLNAAVVFFGLESSFSLLPFLTKLCICSLFLVNRYEIRLAKINYFLQTLATEKLMAETERREAKEIRAAIGNIAHDLKTPLTAFETGIDMLKDIYAKLLTFSQKPKMVPSDIPKTFIISLGDCVSNLKNIDAFMLMSINRCIDYTKATKGVRLNPKFDTVNVLDSVQFPVECMKSIQERVVIEVSPIPEDIDSHIYTDRQWLQENLLCLLSNAVKYTTSGDVKVIVQKRKRDKTTPLNKSEPIVKSRLYSDDFISPCTSISPSNLTPTSISCPPEQQAEEELYFEVTNNGDVVVTEEKGKKLFQDPNQTERLVGGTGIGLFSLAKRIEALQGQCGFKNRNDIETGTTVWFTIPYHPAPKPPATPRVRLPIVRNVESFSNFLEMESESEKLPVIKLPRPMPTTVSVPSPREERSNKCQTPSKSPSPVILVSPQPSTDQLDELKNLQILIVDDSPSIVKMSSMMLKRQGHVITSAENGEIALKKIEEKWKSTGKGFDLVLMDLQMPVMDGLEATRRLRQMEFEGLEWMKSSTTLDTDFSENSPPHQIIFGVSATSDEDTIQQTYHVGMDEFIAKPFSVEKVMEKLLQRRTLLCLLPSI